MAETDTNGLDWPCYNTKGAKTTWDDKSHLPCNLTAVAAGLHSTCCAVGDTCLTNGFCAKAEWINKRNYYIRDGCTDKTWQDPACPKYCGTIEPDRNTGLAMQCPGRDSWCCAIVGVSLFKWPKTDNINTTCCSMEELTFSAAAPVAYAKIPDLVQSGTPSKQSISTVFIEKTILETATVTPGELLSSPSLSGTSSSGPSSSSPSSNSPSSSSSTTSSDAQQSSDSGGLSTGAKIGLGVGIPVAVLGLAVLCIFFWLRRKRAANASNVPLELPGVDMNGNGHGHVPPKQLEAKIYRHEAPTSNETYELPAAPKLSELSSSDTSTAELPVPNQDIRPGTQTR
ncbi:hypothetical protein C7974DRAFT_468415 [Boeremia exigua]|uniref:uncharacterized protein n=1 Tax=Boeremia exigua TaxID=749465 RepID=UPI001E8E83E0|nr:uncharacterized protein C7974DRAFT_468415 [Boeremia exigua]KAH6641945.1 hypothetical protein C7974DRAFT_468415 [Boeremia exigua]